VGAFPYDDALIEPLIESIGDGVIIVDSSVVPVRWNLAAERIVGAPTLHGGHGERWVERPGVFLPDRVTPAPLDSRPLYRAARRGEHVNDAELYILPPGKTAGVLVSITARPLRDAGGNFRGAIAVFRDVTLQRELQRDREDDRAALARKSAELETVLANIRDGVALLDHEHRLVLANAAYIEMFGLDRHTLAGMNLPAFLEHVAGLMDEPEQFRQRLGELARHPTEATDEFRLRHPRRRVLVRTVRPIEMPHGPGHLVIWHDVTAERDLASEREHQIMSDALTGIANRRSADASLRRELARSERAGAPLCVAMFDVDHFKRVNDEHGHAAGDSVLCEVARVLSGSARLTDSVARWGGEEFIAILPVPLEGALSYCERVRGAVAALTLATGTLTISAGVAEARSGEGVADVVRRADELLYEAKRAGRNRVVG
jgi:diguanylate cyclase (GGDEF)-like protein/PAS domain S-box-containing protein